MIKDTYVSFETAKLLKEKGFDEICVKFCWKLGERFKESMDADCPNNFDLNIIYTESYSMPTQALAMRWLREEHNLHFSVQPVVASARTEDTKNVYYVEFYEYDDSPDNYKGWHSRSYLRDESYNSYEEACETAIKYCLENLI